MPYVKRANVVLEVKEDSVQHYLDLGYSVMDENGNITVQAIPNDLGELKKFYVDATAKIKELEARIAELEIVQTVQREEVPKKRGRKPSTGE